MSVPSLDDHWYLNGGKPRGWVPGRGSGGGTRVARSVTSSQTCHTVCVQWLHLAYSVIVNLKLNFGRVALT